MITNHKSQAVGESQCSIILRTLELWRGKWCPMPTLAAASGAYAVHSRISDLRKAGHVIQHKNERHESNREVHSYYMMPEIEPVMTEPAAPYGMPDC